MLIFRKKLLLGLSLAVVGCAQTKAYTPSLAPARVSLSGLPTNRVTVEVADLRADQGDGKLAGVLKQQVEASFGAPDAGTSKAVLHIDVIEQGSNFEMANWNGKTRLRARITMPDGSTKGPFEASGSGKRANSAGYSSAKNASQDSYNAAVADLMSQLSAVSLK